MSFFVFGNWKMQLDCSQAADLARETVIAVEKIPQSHGVTVGVFPSSLHCGVVGDVVEKSPVSWGVQDVSMQERGAFTGQISAQDAAYMKACYGLVGHAEVRKHLGDDDEKVVAKAVRCRDAGLIPIVCFGGEAHVAPAEQAKKMLQSLMAYDAWERIILAFEPLASIGSGVAYDVDVVAELAREVVQCADRVSFVYGGSVNAENVGAFVRAGVQGVLVGGSSQDPDAWSALLQAVCAEKMASALRSM